MLKEKIQADMKTALREKDAAKLSALRMLLASAQNREKEKRARLSAQGNELTELDQLSKLSDDEMIEVISSEIKKRRDSLEQYSAAGRQDLADAEKGEIGFLIVYLPAQMSEEEIRKVIKEKMAVLGISGKTNLGKLMSQVMPQLKGKADGGVVNKIALEELQG